MFKKIFGYFFIAGVFLQSLSAMEAEDWHKSRIYNRYFPIQCAVDQNVKNKFAARLEFFEGLIGFVRMGDFVALCNWCEKHKIEAKDFNEFKFDEAGNSFLHNLVSDWTSETSSSLDYFTKYDNQQKDLKDKYYFESVKKCIKYLIEKYNLNLKKTNNEGLTVMHIAASCGKLVFIKIFLDLDTELLKLKHKRGKTPFLMAAHEGQWKSIQLFLENGVDLYTTDIRGWNIFHILIKEKKVDCCKMLVRWVKNKMVLLSLLTAKDSYGKRPLDCADKHFRHELERLLGHF